MLFVCNVSEDELATAEASSPHVAAVRQYAETHVGTEAVVVSAAIESELAELPEAEAKEYLAHHGVSDSGVSTLIRAAYHLLGLRTYLTAGEKEARAWTIHAGDTAPQAAGVIHSDFERGFIKAETVFYDDLARRRFHGGRARRRASFARKARITSSRTATSSSSSSMSESYFRTRHRAASRRRTSRTA